jgi:hypothetical protein
MDIGTLFAQPFVLSGKYVSANGGIETVTPSSATARLDATLAPSSVPNGALSNFSVYLHTPKRHRLTAQRPFSKESHFR